MSGPWVKAGHCRDALIPVSSGSYRYSTGLRDVGLGTDPAWGPTPVSPVSQRSDHTDSDAGGAGLLTACVNGLRGGGGGHFFGDFGNHILCPDFTLDRRFLDFFLQLQ